jgi:hypothetical protein
MMLAFTSGLTALPPIGSTAWFGMVLLLLFLWCCIEREQHLALALGVKRGERRLVRILRRLHTNLLIRWLRGRILALQLLYAFLEVRNRTLNVFRAHKLETGPIWPWPNSLNKANDFAVY